MKMRSFLRVYATAFLFLFIVMTNVSDMARLVGADDEGETTCEAHSKLYRGMCVKQTCEAVCESEGFTGGHCKGLRLLCYCTKECPL